MRYAFVLAAALGLVMVAALVYGFAVGDFWGEGRMLTRMPWGIVSLVDVYVGFCLFLGWVAFREASVPRTLMWGLLVFALGNAITCGYVLLTLVRSRGDWRLFWMGTRAA